MDIIAQMNQISAKKVAVDIPSGIHAEKGCVMEMHLKQT